jgi:hypothetical protein
MLLLITISRFYRLNTKTKEFFYIFQIIISLILIINHKLQNSDFNFKEKSNKFTVYDILLQARIIQRNGYPIEKHKVTTKDGYLLEMHRLPRPGKPVVFLQHGFTCSSAVWIHMGPDHSLGE